MNARIDIKTPARKSLEGFPHKESIGETSLLTILLDLSLFINKDPQLHSGDTITIEIL